MSGTVPGVDGVGLDFGIVWRQDTVTQTDSLPPELIRFAGELGLGVEYRTISAQTKSEAPQGR
jgi:hypothetical protein